MPKLKHSQVDSASVKNLYEEEVHWYVNTGGERIHPRAVAGRYRNFKYLGWLNWALYVLLPYVRWNGKQAILFDIPGRQFHLFSITIYPQDIWMLSFVLIMLALLLAGTTAVAGRAFCGYLCFQTVWTDWFVHIEERIEGNPIQRRKLDAAPWNAEKLVKRGLKYATWSVISLLTGITFVAYFTDSHQLWHDYLTLQAHPAAWITLLAFFMGTFVFAGFLREQVCFWLCPYARIQSVMVDKDTIIPTYDQKRGEPRGKLKAGVDNSQQGDCIACKLCVAVCPTGIDIRDGLQEGCIMCGLCIDACDSVMDRVGKPQGLVRYASQKEIQGITAPPVYKRPRVIFFVVFFAIGLAAIINGLMNISPLEWHVLHERQPLYAQMSDGTVQNSYTFKLLNKTPENMRIRISVTGLSGLRLNDADNIYVLKPNNMTPFIIRARALPADAPQRETPITFTLENLDHPGMIQTKQSFFARP